MKKIGVFTSGGDAPGMNACIRAVVRTGIHHGLEVVGITKGYQGILDKNFKVMTSHSVSGIIQKGGTILKSARCTEFRTKKGRKKAYKNLKEAGIDGVVAIGGDGTFTGAEVFMKEFPDIKFVGCPGTIDNDLYGTDFTIGYDTLLPETKTDIKRLVKTIEAQYKKKEGSSIIVIVAEGEEMGGAVEVARKVSKKFTALPTRVTILGHVQRGGSPTAAERVNASWMGVEAVRALIAGKKGIMIGVVNNEVVHTPFKKAIKHNREISPTLLDMIEILA